MNILHVTEGFTSGGLEQSIDSFSKEMLVRNHKIYLAAGAYTHGASSSIDPKNIYESFNFSKRTDITIGEYIADVNRLCQIIKCKNIDLIIIHPFYSLYPAICAAKLLSIPAVYMVHGIASLSFPGSAPENALFRICIDLSIDHVFTVNEYVTKSISKSQTPISTLNNPVTAKSISRPVQNKHWAIASRLDDDKIEGIIAILEWVPQLDIEHIDIYGDGNRASMLQERVRQLGLEGVIDFHPYNRDWLNEVSRNCMGVIAFGRTAIEALAVNLPVLLINARESPCGLVNDQLFCLSLSSNFSSLITPRLKTPEELQSQLSDLYQNPEKYNFGNRVRNLYSAQRICDEFTKQTSNLTVRTLYGWPDFFRMLDKLPDQNASLFNSEILPQILENCFSAYTADPSSKNSLILASQEFNLQYTFKRIDSLEERALAAEARVQSLEERALAAENQLTNTTNEYKATSNKSKKSLRKMSNQLVSLSKEVNAIKDSRSWKIGRVITAVPRKLKRIAKTKKRK